MLKLENIWKEYEQQNGNKVIALENINLEFNCCEMICIVGESGCGKSTLINILSGIDEMTKGNYVLGNCLTSTLSESDWDDYRNVVFGVLFQDNYLFENETIQYNLSLPGKINHISHEKSLNEVLRIVGLERYENRKVKHLSGGQKQRVAIARALMNDPNIILADEPTANLDSDNAFHIFSLLKKISAKKLVIVVTHDKDLANKFGDKVITMRDGKILDVMEHTRNEIGNFELSILSIDKRQNIEGNGFQELYSKIKKTILQDLDNANNLFSISLKCDRIDNFKKTNAFLLPDLEYVRSQTQRMPKKDLFKESIQDLFRNKKRFIVSLIMYSLLMFLLLTVLFLGFGNQKRVITDYLDTYEINDLVIYKEASYTNKFFDIKQKNLYKDKTMYSFIESLDMISSLSYCLGQYHIQDNKNMVGESGNNSVNEIYGVSIYLFSGNKNDITYKGSFPVYEDEIMVTDYLFDTFGYTLDKKNDIYINDVKFTITGYIVTDYKTYGIHEKTGTTDYTDISDYKLNYEYMTAYVSESAMAGLGFSKEVLDLPLSNFLYSNNFSRYTSKLVKYGSVEEERLNDIDLVWGRYPSALNEVLVSKSYLHYAGIDDYDKIQNSYFFNNMYDEYYGNFYRDSINLYEFFKEGIKIVGVYEKVGFDSDVANSDVIINPTIFAEIMKQYYRYYVFDNIRVHYTDLNQVVQELYNHDYQIDEPNIIKINDFFNSVNKYFDFILLGTIVLAFLVIFLLINTLSNSILDKNRNIGILRLIGVKKKDTMVIFSLQSVILVVSGLLLGFVGSIIALKYMNHFSAYQFEVYENYFNLIIVNNVALLLVFIGGIILGFICTYIPINRFSKLKPYEIIKF